MSVASSGVKKRKKTDTKPQSQINKCLNEKRRREQENIFIEELAELISVSFSDMNSLSVKPDKCAILQETVHQIRNIKQDELKHHQHNPQGVVSTDDIQQGEVSSSKPTIFPNEIVAPLLLDALEGFAFLLNHEGKLEYISDNVSELIKFTKDDLIGKSIYQIIHPNDQGRFSSCLLPTSVGNWNQSGSGSGGGVQSRNRSSFNCRLLMKPSTDPEESSLAVDSKERSYENVQISCAVFKGDGSSGCTDSGNVSSECIEMIPGLLCVARRVPTNEKHLSAPIEQFTTKLDTTGRIIAVDTSGVSSTYSLYLNKDLMGKVIQELCHHEDLRKLNMHLKETLHTGQSTSRVFRFMVSTDKFIKVQTKSRFFKCQSNPSEKDFIMATHSIIGDNDVCQMIESNSPLLQSTSTASSQGGGPMVSALNGRQCTVTTPDNATTITLPSHTEYQTFPMPSDIMTDHELFLGTSLELYERPASRHSLASTSSPLSQYCQVSPMTNAPSTPYPAVSFESDKKDDNIMMTDGGVPNEINESARLRNLLTSSRKPNVVDEEMNNSRRIMENRLNQEDGMDISNDSNSNSSVTKKPVMVSVSDSSSNPMLLKLLNNKRNENEELEKHAVLHQLLSIKEEDSRHSVMMDQDIHHPSQQQLQLNQTEDTILKGIGFTNISSPPDGGGGGGGGGRMRKRHSEDAGDSSQPSKKQIPAILESIPAPPQTTVVQNRTTSNLQERNKMLAQLLAKEPASLPIIPHVPPSIIYATPQDRLPKVTVSASRSPQMNTGNNAGQMQQNQLRMAMHQQQLQHRSNVNANFLNDLLQQQPPQQQLQQIQRQMRINNNNNIVWNSNTMNYCEASQQSDPELSSLLDQIIENISENITGSDAANFMSLIETMQPNESISNTAEISAGVSNVTLNNPAENNEQAKTNAINKIYNQFLQYEQSTSHNRITGLPPSIMGQPHSQQQQQHAQQQSTQPLNIQASQQFQPPPMYPQRPTRMMPQNVVQMAARRQQYATTAGGHFTVQGPTNMASHKYLQSEQKRLLEQQQNQHLLVSANATANSPASTSLQNMDLLNNSVAPPNVSLLLQRSTDVSNTPQLSPGGNPTFGNAMLSSPQISPSQRQQSSGLASPYSPLNVNQQQQSFSSVNFNTSQPSPSQSQGTRLSPSGLPPFQSQLSPRVSQPQTSYAATTAMTSQGVQQQHQQNAWTSQQQQTQQQSQQQQLINSRLNMQQQQNPLLDARLSGTGYTANNRTLFIQQQQQHQQQQKSQAQPPQISQVRGLTSPGSTTYTTTSQQQQQQQQQYRIQRTLSMPGGSSVPNSPVPAGNNCIRPYSSNLVGNSLNIKDTMPQNTPPHAPPLYPPMMYPHHGDSSPYCYPEQSLSMYGDRSRIMHSSGNNNGNNNSSNSEYVRHELRAKVSGRMPSTTLGGIPESELAALGLSLETMSADTEASKWVDVNEGSPSTGLSMRSNTLNDMLRTNVVANPNTMNMSNVSGAEKGSPSLLQKLLSET